MPEKDLRILFAEDIPTDAELNQRALHKSGLEFSSRIVYQREEYLKALNEYNPDIIISDFNMPQFTGMEALEIKNELYPGLPFIIVTGALNEETAVECIRLGADDYLLKGRLARLPSAVKMALEKKRLECVEQQTREFIQRSAREWRTTFDAMNEGVALLDLERNIVRCNTALRDMIGKPWDQLIGQPLCHFFHGSAESIQDCPALRAIHSQKGERQQTAIGASWFNLAVDPILDEEGCMTGLVHTFIDITELKEAEQQQADMQKQLLQSQKLESIGTLAGGVAHEINNPVNGILNYAQLIKDNVDAGSKYHEFASEIIVETERVAEIVRNLLTFARQDKQSHSPARMTDIVRAATSLIQTIIRGDMIALESDVPEDLPELKCRSQQIQQVIMNLLTNSRDALNQRYKGYDENKIIRISTRSFERGSRRWIRTTVEDHGAGIREKDRERIFDPFYTTKGRTLGTGLGLSISHGIVVAHHGKLTFESVPNEYTRFHLDLPVDNGWGLDE